MELEEEAMEKRSKGLEERRLFKADMEEEEEEEGDIYNIKIRRVEEGAVKNKEEMDYGSCCDSSHDDSSHHNFRLLFSSCLYLLFLHAYIAYI